MLWRQVQISKDCYRARWARECACSLFPGTRVGTTCTPRSGLLRSLGLWISPPSPGSMNRRCEDYRWDPFSAQVDCCRSQGACDRRSYPSDCLLLTGWSLHNLSGRRSPVSPVASRTNTSATLWCWCRTTSCVTNCCIWGPPDWNSAFSGSIFHGIVGVAIAPCGRSNIFQLRWGNRGCEPTRFPLAKVPEEVSEGVCWSN